MDDYKVLGKTIFGFLKQNLGVARKFNSCNSKYMEWLNSPYNKPCEKQSRDISWTLLMRDTTLKDHVSIFGQMTESAF